MQGYECKVINASKELSARERIKVKDLSNAIALDTAVTDDTPLMISPLYDVELEVHNEKSKDKDYTKYVIVDVGGNKYHTGSESFWTSYKDIMAELGDDTEDVTLEVYRVPSKNYAGKSFITCSLA
jgi:hypothetical protein